MLTEAWLAVLVILACAAGLGLGVRHTLETRTSSLSVAADGQTRLTEELESVIPLRDGRSYRVRLHATSEPITDDDAMRDPGALRTRSASIERTTADDTDAPGAFLAFDEASLRDGPMRIALPEGALLLRGERGAESFLSGQLAFDARYRSWSAAGGLRSMVSAFVDGAANLLAAIGIPVSLGVALMGVMVASFAGTTMDTACRLQRYVIQELSRTFLPRPPQQACIACGYDLSGLHVGMTCPECGSGAPPVEGAASLAAQRRAASVFNPFKWLSTAWGAALFAIVSAAMLAAMPAQGQAWSLANAGQGGLILWPLFGATNQLLAGLAFIVLYAWLRATGRARWFTVGPTLFMLLVPASAMAWQGFIGNAENPSWLTQRNWTLVGVASATLALESWLIVEAIIRMARPLHAPPDDERTTNDAAP
ncbi:MAG: hypothetical protein EA379_02595 [Phycisphaerales bacterium]|nr:MAG: hypothetical protein EA379_02595 [Phycisphaerales bacterium]